MRRPGCRKLWRPKSRDERREGSTTKVKYPELLFLKLHGCMLSGRTKLYVSRQNKKPT
jgi:hypothetical protein